jgi:hypothetical protein
MLASAVSAMRCALAPFALEAGFDSQIALLAGRISVLYFGSTAHQIEGGADGPYFACEEIAGCRSIHR